MEDLAEKAAAALARIKAFDTPENEHRLRAELAKHGWKLKGKAPGKARFAVVDPKGNEISGTTLADVDDLAKKIQSSKATDL